MRVVMAAVIVACLCGPAFAQSQPPVPQYGEEDKDLTPGQKETKKEAERAYRRSLGNIPEQKPSDPWGTVRGSDNAAKPAEKPAAKKSKTSTGATKSGTAAN